MLRIAPPRQLRRRLGDSRFDTGQSFVEFALILPVLLLLTLVALDFGRVYLGWVNLQNLTRIAANFAANHPDAWLTGEAPTITQYNNQIISDASATNCQLTPTTPDSPVFTDMNGDGVTTGLGDHATVTLTCRFRGPDARHLEHRRQQPAGHRHRGLPGQDRPDRRCRRGGLDMPPADGGHQRRSRLRRGPALGSLQRRVGWRRARFVDLGLRG
jgi:hypothetical protein